MTKQESIKLALDQQNKAVEPRAEDKMVCTQGSQDLQAWPDDSTGLENTFRLSCPSFIKTDTTSLSESPNVILQGLCLVFILQKGINPTFITFLLCIMSPSLGKK